MPGPADPQDDYLPDEPCIVCGQPSAVRITVKAHRTDDDDEHFMVLLQEYYCADHYAFDSPYGRIIIGAPGEPGTIAIPIVLEDGRLDEIDWKGWG